MGRNSKIERKTKETDIKVELELDGMGKASIETGIGFFNHMLEGLARHGFLDLNVSVKGDLEVDAHHSIEDAGIVFGQALKEALADKCGIKRYGSCILPMDDALVMCAIDLCGRPYFDFNVEFLSENIGDMPSEMVREFFYAVSYSAGMNLHIKQLSGINSHHIAEAIFKAFARALDEAKTIDSRIDGVISTKGSL